MPSRPPHLIKHGSLSMTLSSALDQKTPLLGGLTPTQFMRRHWHRKPLLIRQAYTGGQAVIDRATLIELAARDDVEARLITQRRSKKPTPGSAAPSDWALEHGPFESDELPSFKTKLWTLLVQGVNLHHPAAHALMEQFRFISDARLDDVMVSYATDGGGVGPHFDSYDVFLLQVHGKRRWRISAQKDLSLTPGLPLKVLQNFEAEQEWLLEPGDMLYLPPHIAHDGVAEGESITASIGFRAPRVGEMQSQFLYQLAEQLPDNEKAQRRYNDAGQPPTAEPARVPPHMTEKVADMLAQIRWNEQDIERFLGRYMSEPKQNVFFEAPSRPLALPAFLKKLKLHGAELDPKTRLLYDQRNYYINGENAPLDATLRRELQSLANTRLVGEQISVTLSHDSPVTQLLYEWYCAGWMRFS